MKEILNRKGIFIFPILLSMGCAAPKATIQDPANPISLLVSNSKTIAFGNLVVEESLVDKEIGRYYSNRIPTRIIFKGSDAYPVIGTVGPVLEEKLKSCGYSVKEADNKTVFSTPRSDYQIGGIINDMKNDHYMDFMFDWIDATVKIKWILVETSSGQVLYEQEKIGIAKGDYQVTLSSAIMGSFLQILADDAFVVYFR